MARSTSRRTRPSRDGILRAAEHLFAEDVAQDLRRAALDRVGPHPQERVLQPLRRRPGRVEFLGAAEGVVVADLAVHPHQVDAEVVEPLVELGVLQLGDRHLRARVAGAGPLGRAHGLAGQEQRFGGAVLALVEGTEVSRRVGARAVVVEPGGQPECGQQRAVGVG